MVVPKSNGSFSPAVIAIIVIVIIIAAAGWGAYAAFPLTKTSVSTSVSTTTVTSGGVSVSTSVSTTTVTSGGVAGGNSTVFLPPTTSTDSFTIASLATVSDFAIFGFAEQLGTIKQYAPNAQTTTFASGAQLITGLTSGQVQLEVLDTSAPIPAIIKGQPVTVVANLLATPLPWAIYVLANSPYHSLSDLHGKAFGVTQLGTVTSFVTEYALAKSMNWTVNTDYTLAAMGGNAAENAALLQGTLPARVGTVNSMYPYVQSGQVRAIYNFTLGYPDCSLLGNTAFVNAHPTAVSAALSAFTSAAYVWDTNSTMAVSFLQSHYNLTLSSAQFTYGLEHYSLDGSMSLSRNQYVTTFLMLGGAITQNISVSDFITPGFVPIYA